MKHISLLCALVGLSVSVWGQEVVIDTNYYAPPPIRRHVLTEDPDKRLDEAGTGRYRLVRKEAAYWQLEQFKETQTLYISAEGGFRSDGSTLSNSFDGLIRNPTSTKAAWSVLAGYTYRNAWAIEVGYAYAPTHLNITIENGSSDFEFTYQTAGHAIPLRVKRRIGSGRQAKNGTGFWVSAGAWLIPASGNQTDELKFSGYITSNRGRRVDTLQLLVNSTSINRVSGLAELGVDYATRLSSTLELGFYVRKYWGLSDVYRSDLAYVINRVENQRAAMVANGSGWGFGIALRYLYEKRYEMKKSR